MIESKDLRKDYGRCARSTASASRSPPGRVFGLLGPNGAGKSTAVKVLTTLARADAGTRATYGVSPGDEHHGAPYAYVAPWTPPPAGPLWRAVGFTGAERSAADPETTAAFWLECRAGLERGRG